MSTSGKPTLRFQSLLLVFLLFTSVMIGFSQSPNVEAASARATGNETVSVNVLSDYYSRGTNMTLAVTSLNLDTGTEYSLEYTLCRATGTWNEDTTSMDIDCTEMIEQVSSSIDIGSGNMFASTVLSVADPGCCQNGSSASDSFSNGTMMFQVNLTSQNVTVSSGWSDVFVLGGGIVSQNLAVSNENILVGMRYNVHAFANLEFNNLKILPYITTCSLLDTLGNEVGTQTGTWNGDGGTIDPFFQFTPIVAGNFAPHCVVTREANGEVLSSMTGSQFTVIEANYTGMESFDAQTNSDYYNHNETVTLEVNMTDLYVGTEYELNVRMCYSYTEYEGPPIGYIIDCGPSVTQGDVRYGLPDDPSTTTVNESEVVNFTEQVTFTPTSSSHSESIIFTLPACCGDVEASYPDNQLLSINSLRNTSFLFDVDVKLFDITLADDFSNTFILGGKVVAESITYDRDTILIGMWSTTESRWWLDTPNHFTLDYTTACDFVNSTGDIVAFDSDVWNHNGPPGANIHLMAPAPGEYHSECTLIRDIDGQLMGTHAGGILTVLDANYTGNEQHDVSTDALYYPHDSTIALSVSTTDMYPGTTYTFEYELCKLETDYEDGAFTTSCDDTPSFSSINISSENMTLVSGSVDFIPTSASHTELITITVPECCGEMANNIFWSIENGSMAFKSTLSIHGVELDVTEDVSTYFTLGGNIASSAMMHPSLKLLTNMNLIVDMIWELDHRNEFILSYEEECKFIDGATLTVLDTNSALWNHRPEQINTLNSVFSPPVEGEYFVECTLTRVVDSALMATHTGEMITVLPDMANQDDATVASSILVKPAGWAMVLISMNKLDAGQSYSIAWQVLDTTSTPPNHVMDFGDFTWVEGSDSVEQFILDFNALDDSTKACFTVDLYAAGDLVDSLNDTGGHSQLCWAQNSTSDLDADGVFDKNDLCAATPFGSIVQTDGCSDADLDGWDDSVEISCNSDYQNPTSVPVDYDADGLCDPLDDDDDNDGFTDEAEILRGTNPYDVNDTPTNQLPVCSVYYTLEADGIPIVLTGEAILPVLPIGTSSVPGAGTGIIPILTIPSGNYYVIAVCEDIDNDPITLTINEITIGPVFGQVIAGAMVTLSPDVNETVDAIITWNDGTNTATTVVTVNMQNIPSSNNSTPGFSMVISVLSLLGAAVLIRQPKEEF